MKKTVPILGLFLWASVDVLGVPSFRIADLKPDERFAFNVPFRRYGSLNIVNSSGNISLIPSDGRLLKIYGKNLSGNLRLVVDGMGTTAIKISTQQMPAPNLPEEPTNHLYIEVPGRLLSAVHLRSKIGNLEIAKLGMEHPWDCRRIEMRTDRGVIVMKDVRTTCTIKIQNESGPILVENSEAWLIDLRAKGSDMFLTHTRGQILAQSETGNWEVSGHEGEGFFIGNGELKADDESKALLRRDAKRSEAFRHMPSFLCLSALSNVGKNNSGFRKIFRFRK